MAAGRQLVLDLSGPVEADFDLYLRFGQRPSNVQYDLCSHGGTSKEKIEVESTQEGDYFAMVYAYSGRGPFALGAGTGNQPGLLIISSRNNLENKYGPEITFEIIEKINAYAQSVADGGKTVRTVFVDNAEDLSPFGLDPADATDASAVKALLDQLDRKVNFDSFLIVGGHEIIPFHVLPNPCGDDGDTVVYSDSPYASRDTDVLIPERALTRLPDDAAIDGTFFLGLLDQVAGQAQGATQATFGLSAKVWQGASNRVFDEIEANDDVRLSPPITHSEIDDEWIDDKASYYFNLHGSEETANWYGQKGSRYPVAFMPEI